VFLKLLREMPGDMKIATGYLNLTREYLEAMG
jgi:ATP phosphoribosyltransferase